MAERTSWLAIQSGWDVADPTGEVVAEVLGVVGDEDADIFDGLRIETGDGEERYVEADRVAEIVEGRVVLDAAPGEIESDAPGGAELSRYRDAEL